MEVVEEETNYDYIASPPVGLEVFCEEELFEKCSNFKKISSGKGYIRFSSTSDPFFLIGPKGLQSIDKLFAFLYEGTIGLGKEELQRLEELPKLIQWEPAFTLWHKMYPLKPHPRTAKENLTFRATVERSGNDKQKHDFVSTEAAVELGAGVIEMWGWKAKMIGYELEVFGNIREDSIFMGISLCDYVPDIKYRNAVLSKRHRVEWSSTTLNSAIAYCMCRAARIKPGYVVLDPMAGSGMIPIEGALHWPNAHYICSDIGHQESITATKNIQSVHNTGIYTKSPLNISVVNANVIHLPFENNSVDVVISDLPFGRRHLSFSKNMSLYPKMFAELNRITKDDGRLVLLTLERGIMKRIFKDDEAVWRITYSSTINVGGLAAELFIIEKMNQRNSSSPTPTAVTTTTETKTKTKTKTKTSPSTTQNLDENKMQ